MISRMREADCPQTAFVEAPGNPCPWLVFQCDNAAIDPTKPGLQVTLEDNWRPVGRLQSTNQCLHPGDRSQRTIQYP
jgi:hypothetical protein